MKLVISKRKNKMAIVLQVVDKEGFIREQFFDLVYVKDTTSLALKKAICEVFYGLQVFFAKSLMRMFDFVCVVLQDIIKSKNLAQRSEGDEIYNAVASVDFVFILHFLIEMLGIIDDLCLKFKEHGWDPLFKKVKLFCKDHEIEVFNLSALYKVGQGQSRIQKDNLTIKHHYRFDIFITSIGSLLIEMNSHFNDEVMKLLVLSYVLDPSDNYKAFWVEDIYKLMNDFYLDDFTKQEKLHMKIQLEHFQLDAHQSKELQKTSTVAELCQVLAKTSKLNIYPLLDRIIRLVLTSSCVC
ncbi:hypothetical protein PVK06_030603 [Gossypium arboreum]|uniref:DUF4371 domain-containing protein n=1 Tax=Gossypium arboreum TaxID=29729 RepID=A0ABR0NP97_GOSAR|nr:hypothetical protein PVK06_030603 [Gossypium arboreum]